MRKPALVAYDAFVAMFFAGSIAGESLMSFTGDVRGTYPDNFMAAPSWGTLLIFAMAFALAFATLRFIRTMCDKRGGRRFQRADDGPSLTGFLRKNMRLFAFVLIVVAAAWTFLLTYFFPATSMNDQLYCIDTPVEASKTHPLLLNLAMAAFANAGLELTGSANAGIALYVELQITVCAAVVSFCCLWLRFRRVPQMAVILVAGFFALVPIASSYSVSLVKDTLFSYVLLLWVPFLVESAAHPKRFWEQKTSYLALFALIALTALTRNNGMALVAALSVVLAIASFRHLDWPRFAISLVCAFALAAAPGVYAKSQGVEHLLRETLSIPLQQVASVLCDEGGAHVPEEDRAFLEQLFANDCARTGYAPAFADKIKYGKGFKTMYLQDHGADFARSYVELGVADPMCYARAHGSATYGNWSLFARHPLQSYFVKLSSNGKDKDTDRRMERFALNNHSLLPAEVDTFLESTYVPALDLYPGPGQCFALLLLVGFALTARYRSARPLLALSPYMLLWATLMLATPLSTALRYAFPMLVALPFLTALLFARPQPLSSGCAGSPRTSLAISAKIGVSDDKNEYF